VHGIFSPDTKFTEGAGTWGNHGAVQVPDRDKDFVFFVTYGHKEGDHKFEESLTETGILTWQSQPRQKLNEKRIQKWIKHDELINNIYLFLRTDDKDPYQYLGRIKYLTHDTSREQPVYFKWQLLDWDNLIPSKKLKNQLVSVSESPPAELYRDEYLRESEAPTLSENYEEIKKPSFKARIKPDYADQDAKNRELGLAGELKVIEHQKEILRLAGRPDLSEKVQHTSVIEGDGAGYDIRSYHPETGTVLYIEVKTTKGNKNTAFYISENERRFADEHEETFVLYRVFNFDLSTKSGEFFTLSGEEFGKLTLTPTSYRVSLKK
jgi:hypothetical protein